MRKPIILGSSLLATLTVALSADAGTLYVSPTGTATTGCTRDKPCDLASAASSAVAGDTVILLDGTYKTALSVANSGTSSAWITFQADTCATPIIEGVGDPSDQPTGVGSSTATYLRFIGLVSRGWNAGFANGWTGSGTTNSNGHFEYQYCIADGNGRTGFTFYSAAGLHIQSCISAHNGSSSAHSWSSGMTLYEAQGSDNRVEGSISFENMDAEKHTDGSGFIVDESSNNATFVNNLAFGNGGSCLRLTKSSGTKFINNTCYHNARDSQDTGPSDPSELYFTNATTTGTTQNVSFLNNVLVATGTGPGAKVVVGQPSSGWSNNVTATGSVAYFNSPDGTNPNFTLSSSGASALIGKGATGSGVPSNDIGFDPKCITKQTPTMIGTLPRGSWWQYSVDLNYIKSIGGVAKCFNPKSRSGTPDIGAYANGSVNTASACTPSTGGSPGTGGTGTGGKATGGTATGGMATGGKATGGAATGGNSTGGSASPTGGSPPTGGISTLGGTMNSGGAADSGGSTTGGSGTGGSGGSPETCNCKTASGTGHGAPTRLVLLCLAFVGWLRRQRRGRS